MYKLQILRVAISGDMCSGKSTLCSRLTDTEISDRYISTIGVDYMSKHFPEVNIKIALWDLAGDNRFEPIIRNYFKHVSVIMFVYNAQYPEATFRSLKKQFLRYKHENIITDEHKIIIVCNLVDKIGNHDTTSEEDFASYINADFIKVSSKLNLNIDILSEMLLDNLTPIIEQIPETNNVKRNTCDCERCLTQ